MLLEKGFVVGGAVGAGVHCTYKIVHDEQTDELMDQHTLRDARSHPYIFQDLFILIVDSTKSLLALRRIVMQRRI